MDTLSSRDWRSIAELWGELGDLGVADVDRAWAHAWQRISELMDSQGGFTTVQRRVEAPVDDFLFGFRMAFNHSHGPDSQLRQERWRAWIAENPGFSRDPLVRQMLAEAGRPRTFIQPRIVAPRTFDRAPIRRLFDELDVEDRLISVIPIAPGLEISFGFDRLRGAGAYREHDRQMLAAIMSGLGPLAKAVVRSHGLMPGQSKLSPREREVLAYLLGPLGEKEIADRLDLSPAYVHQIVVAIYRKLGVQSRPELMAMWL